MVYLTAHTSPVFTTPQINDSASDHQYVFAASDLAADRIVTLPLLTGPDTFVFEDHAQTLTNKTLTAPVIATISNSGTVTLPTATDTLVGRATTDTLTNKTLNTTTNVIVGALRPGVVAVSVSAANLSTAFENLDLLDGVTLTTGDRILLTAQTTTAENGIWVVEASGAPSRPTDYTGTLPAFGMLVATGLSGTAYGKTLWTCTTNNSALVVGTDANAWYQVTAPMSPITLANLNANVTNATLATTTGTETLTNKTLSSPTLTTPRFVHTGYIADSNGNELIMFQETTSAVNFLELTNSVTSTGVTLGSAGSDTNIDLLLTAKGSGVVQANGAAVVTTSAAQTLTNKTLNLGPSVNGDNTVTMYEVQAHSEAHTLTEVNGWLVVSCTTSSAYTITLPAATGSGVITVADVSGDAGSNTLTVAAAGSDTINGAASTTITAAYNSITLVANGVSAWIMI